MGLPFVLALCIAWTAWKALGLLSRPQLSSWRFLLNDLEHGALAYIIATYLWVLWSFKVLKKTYKNEISLKNIIIGIMLSSPLAAGMIVIKETDLLVVFLTALTFSVFGGLVEEVIYRGLLLDELKKKVNAWVAIMLQSLLFALSHPWSLGAIEASFIFGAFMGILRVKLGIGSCISFHWLMNVATHT